MGPATASVVSKGFRRPRAGHDMVSRGNHHIWAAIRAAADQRDIQVQWIASHEEDTMDGVDPTTAWYIGLNTLVGGVAEIGADLFDFPDTVPALTSWCKSWAIRLRAALTTLDLIEKDPIASQPAPRRPQPSMDDFKCNTEHEISENVNSASCLRCGQRSSRRPAILKRWLQTPCQYGHRIPVVDGAHRMAPAEGQGRFRHQSTHESQTCSFYPALDTWFCLTCGFYGIDVYKSLAHPCSGTPNQAGGDNLSRVRRCLMSGSSRAARENNARQEGVRDGGWGF